MGAQANRIPAPAPATAPAPAFRAGSAATPMAAHASASRSPQRVRVVPTVALPSLQGADRGSASINGPGAPLHAQTRQRLELGFNADLGAVRVHEGAQAARLAQGHGARAFAFGHHVVLGAGESPRDLALMAHEVAHVLQQRGATTVQRCATGGCCTGCSGSAGSAHEAEAARASAAVSNGGNYTVTGQVSAAAPQYEGEDEGILTSLIWKTANAVAPSLVPIMRRGPEGVLDWIKDKISGAIQTVVDTAMAPVRGIADTGKFLHAHVGPLLSSMQEAAARIAQNDCKPITDAAAKIEDLATKLITPVIEKIQAVVGKVGDFLKGVWDKFGTPVWDFLKKYAGEKWAALQQLIGWVWDLVKPVRDMSAKAWTWVKNKIGIGEGPEGQDGILQWVQAKAGKAWDWVQAKIEPYKKQIMTTLAAVAGVALLVSPAGPFILAGAAIYGVVQGVKWIRANLAGGNAIVRARAYAQTVLIPQMIGAINKMTAAVTKMAATVSGKLGDFAAGLGKVVGAAASTALSFLVDAAQWVADKAVDLAAWASEKLSALADWIQRALTRLIEFLHPLLDFLGKLGGLIADINPLPSLLAGLWKKIPPCIRDPFIDWIVPLILKQIDIFKELVKNDEAWTKTKAGVMRIVRSIFVTKDIKGAIRATFDLLLQMFNVPIELLVQIQQKAVAAWDTVSKKPIEFIKNAVRTLGRGFQLYYNKLKDNLLGGLEGWLFGELADKGIAKPRSWTDPWDLVKFGLSVMGLSMPHIFELLEKRFEKDTVDKLRTAWRALSGAWDWIMDMKDKKPADVTKEIVQAGKDMGKSVMEGLVKWIMDQVALELATMATAAAASAGLSEVLDAVRRIYRAIKTAVRWARPILDMVNKTLDAVLDIASGALDGPAEILHGAMKKATPAVIGFLGDQVGLSGVADQIKELIDALREKVDNAILAIIDGAKALFASLIEGAKSLAGKVLEWWKNRIRIKVGGKKLTLITDGTEEQPEVLVESSPAKRWSAYVETLPQAARAMPEFAQAMDLAQKIEAHRKPISETDPAKRAKAEDDAARVMQANANALADLIRLLNGDGSDGEVPATVVSFGAMDDQSGGTSAEATILSKKHPDGTGPEDYAPIWVNLLNLGRGLGKSVRERWYVQGHLLNHNVGGPGRRFNMTPITKQANSDHKNIVEREVKKHVADGEVLHYTVRALQPWGEQAVPRLPALKDKVQQGTATPDEVLETDALRALGKLTRGFVCEAYQLRKVNGKWERDPGGYSPAVETIDNDIGGVGGLPYGYS